MATKQPPNTSTKSPQTGKGQVSRPPNKLAGGTIHTNPTTGK